MGRRQRPKQERLRWGEGRRLTRRRLAQYRTHLPDAGLHEVARHALLQHLPPTASGACRQAIEWCRLRSIRHALQHLHSRDMIDRRNRIGSTA